MITPSESVSAAGNFKSSLEAFTGLLQYPLIMVIEENAEAETKIVVTSRYMINRFMAYLLIQSYKPLKVVFYVVLLSFIIQYISIGIGTAARPAVALG